MLKKLIVGLLIITVIGGAAVANLSQPSAVTPDPAIITPTHVPQGGQNGQGGQAEGTQPVNAAASSVGEVWSGSGTILELTAIGMTLELTDGSEIFVELGPESYWGAQSVTLLAGAQVVVDGFFNGTNYHARALTMSGGAVLTVRDEAGTPLWSGGNGDGSNGGQGQVQIPADQWVTVEGMVTALTNNGLILQTTDGVALTVSFGRADFWQEQLVTFAAGDAVALLGFWQGEQFMPGRVTKTATGERILLRDPNGRPLWAGPGRGQGNGNGGQGTQGTPEATVAA